MFVRNSKLTVPVGLLLPDTVAVNVIGSPALAGFGEAVRIVVVTLLGPMFTVELAGNFVPSEASDAVRVIFPAVSFVTMKVAVPLASVTGMGMMSFDALDEIATMSAALP